jgi:hypothetical protein
VEYLRAAGSFVVTKLDRLACPLPHAGGVLDELTRGNVRLSLGGSIHDPPIPPEVSFSTCSRWLRSSRPIGSGCACGKGITRTSSRRVKGYPAYPRIESALRACRLLGLTQPDRSTVVASSKHTQDQASEPKKHD